MCIFTKDGKLLKKYNTILIPLLKGEKIRCKWEHKGTRLNHTDYSNAIKLATSLSLDYITGNDAPRGGKNGDFVQLTAKGQKQVKHLIIDLLRLKHYGKQESTIQN